MNTTKEKNTKDKKLTFHFKLATGQEVKATYTLFCGGHFEFYGKAISETGYRSHFATIGDSDPKEYAKKIIEELSGIKFDGIAQQVLFD